MFIYQNEKDKYIKAVKDFSPFLNKQDMEEVSECASGLFMKRLKELKTYEIKLEFNPDVHFSENLNTLKSLCTVIQNNIEIPVVEFVNIADQFVLKLRDKDGIIVSLIQQYFSVSEMQEYSFQLFYNNKKLFRGAYYETDTNHYEYQVNLENNETGIISVPYSDNKIQISSFISSENRQLN